jgi:hypothetical protein
MKTKTVTKANTAKALNAAEDAKRLAAKVSTAPKAEHATTPSESSAKPIVREIGKVAQVGKGRTLYAFSMGNGDGVSLFGRMFFFALYEIQGAGDGKTASFKAGKPFRYYPGFNASYFRTKQVIERTADGSAWQFTPAGASMLAAYPIPADAHKQYDAILSAIKTGKPKDTGRDNQKMFAFNV